MGLDSVNLVLAFEEVFQISIPDHEAEKLRVPRDAIECIAALLQVRAEGPAALAAGRNLAALQPLSPQELRSLTRADIAQMVRDITLWQTGLPEKKYAENKRFIEDFGID